MNKQLKVFKIFTFTSLLFSCFFLGYLLATNEKQSTTIFIMCLAIAISTLSSLYFNSKALSYQEQNERLNNELEKMYYIDN